MAPRTIQRRPIALLSLALPAVAAFVATLVAIVQAVAYWPGLMTYDAARQYGQALDGEYDDWHPPAMEWLWRQLLTIHSGLAPMLVLQLLLYWGGFALLAGWALRSRRGGLAAAIMLCALMPIPLALLGAVLKDCLMTGALLGAAGLLALSAPGRSWVLRIAALALLLFAATLRFNAFTAALPLAVALLPARTLRRRLLYGALALAVLVKAMPVANGLIGAERSGVELSLVMFDLGGITEHSGVDAFPPLGIADPIAVNHRCYSPVKWDPYSWWVDVPCPIGFYRLKALLDAQHRSAYALWLPAIARHPIAYAEHRLTHFNINARFLVHDEIERPVQVQSAPNVWRYTIGTSRALALIDRAALASGHTPLGWPIWWMAVAAGALALGVSLPSRAIIVPLASSALLYGLGYAVFSVAAELRYHLWTMLAAALAAVIAGADLADGERVWRGRLAAASAPAVIVAALCALWRLVPAL